MTRGDIGTLEAHLATLRAHAPGVAGSVRRGGAPRDRPCRGTGRAGTGGRGEDARRARFGLASPGRTGTIASHGSQHRGQVRGPAGGPFRPPLDPRPRASARPAPVGFVPCPGSSPDGPARPGGRAAHPPAGRLASHPAGGRAAATERSSAAGGDHGVGQVRAPRRGPRRAPRRRRGPAEDVDRHLRRRDRRSIRIGPAVARRRQPASRARRPDLDPAQGHAQRRRDARADRAPRGPRGDRARGPDHRPARLDRVLVRPVRDAHPQDRPLLPDGADRWRPRRARPRVRRGPLDPVRRRGDDADLRDRAGARRSGRRDARRGGSVRTARRRARPPRAAS